MKKAKNYIISLLLSIIGVFTVIALIFSIIVFSGINYKNAVKFSEQKKVYSIVYDETEKYFANQYNTTGIPKEVYMSAIDEKYIKSVSDTYTEYLLDTLYCGSPQTAFDDAFYRNQALENSITDFFNDYADSKGYEKDENFTKKLSQTIDDAYKVIQNQCDFYKYSAVKNHGVLNKLSVIFRNLKKIVIALGCTAFVLAILILLTNIREIPSFVYWTGIICAVSGLLCSLPCAYLIKSQYFDAFTIKQPQVYTAFTGAMYEITNLALKTSIVVLLAGILISLIYSIITDIQKKRLKTSN